MNEKTWTSTYEDHKEKYSVVYNKDSLNNDFLPKYVSKFVDRSRGRLEGSLFNNYNTAV